MKNILLDPEIHLKFAESYYLMAIFQQKYDHPEVAYNCYITSKTLLDMAKELLSKCKGGKK